MSASRVKADIVSAKSAAGQNRSVAATTRRAKHLSFFRNACQAVTEKIFIFPKDGSYDLKKPSRAHYGGRFAIVTTRGAGCDGRASAARRAARGVRSSR